MRCLFTGAEEPLAREEHAPPKRMGGRFTSQETTCSSFNNDASRIDEALCKSWRPLTVMASAAMSGQHRSTAALDVTIPGATGRWAVRPGQGLVRAGVHHLAHDARGRPTAMAGPVDGLRRVARAALGETNPAIDLELPPLVDDLLDVADLVTLAPDTEVACLKSALVALDITYGCHPGSWVRSELTGLARELVKRTVQEGSPPAAAYLPIMLGVHPAVALRARNLAGTVRRLAPLEHVIIAGAYLGVIDVTWLLFGHEAVSFRVTQDYIGPPFTRVVGCDPLHGGAPWSHDIQGVSWIVPEVGIRTITTNPSSQPQHLLPAILDARGRAVSHAATLGELASEAAMPGHLFNWYVHQRGKGIPPKTVRDLVVGRLVAMYARDGRDVRTEASAWIEEEVSSETLAHAIDVPSRVPAGLAQPWAAEAVPGYLRTLRRLYVAHGPASLVRFPVPPPMAPTRLPWSS